MNNEEQMVDIIGDSVRKIVSDILGLEANKEDSFETLGVGSLDLVEIISRCEQHFNIAIRDDKVQKLKTVGDLVNLVKELDMQDYFESTQADLQSDE